MILLLVIFLTATSSGGPSTVLHELVQHDGIQRPGPYISKQNLEKGHQPSFLAFRLRGGVQGWVDFRSKPDAAKKSKRLMRVEKGRLIKDMKKKFKVSKRKKEKRRRRQIGRTYKEDQEAEDTGSRLASKQSTGLSAERSKAWTGSDEDSTLEILDRNGNKIPVHPDKELQLPPGPSDYNRVDRIPKRKFCALEFARQICRSIRAANLP
jgi:hypothetical protein